MSRDTFLLLILKKRFQDKKYCIYKYSEYLTIPKECFNRKSGEFCIGVKIDYLYAVLIYLFRPYP